MRAPRDIARRRDWKKDIAYYAMMSWAALGHTDLLIARFGLSDVAFSVVLGLVLSGLLMLIGWTVINALRRTRLGPAEAPPSQRAATTVEDLSLRRRVLERQDRPLPDSAPIEPQAPSGAIRRAPRSDAHSRPKFRKTGLVGGLLIVAMLGLALLTYLSPLQEPGPAPSQQPEAGNTLGTLGLLFGALLFMFVMARGAPLLAAWAWGGTSEVYRAAARARLRATAFWMALWLGAIAWGAGAGFITVPIYWILLALSVLSFPLVLVVGGGKRRAHSD